MGAATATSLRRAWFVACALAVTVCAHAATSNAVHLAEGAPLLWAGVFAATFIIGARVPATHFRPWSGPQIIALLAGTQIAAHMVLGAAPWLVGLTTDPGHHHHHAAHAMIDARSLVVHMVAATIIGCLLRSAQRYLIRWARTVVRLVRNAFQHVVPGSTPGRPPHVEDVVPAGLLIGDALRSRGPPVVHAA